MKPLSTNLEDYLEAIFILSQASGKTKITDIGNKLGRSKSSVNTAIKTLSSAGFVQHEHYGSVILTASGRSAGAEILSRHLLLKDFFISILNLPENQAEKDACLAEHTLSKKTLLGLKTLNLFLKQEENKGLLQTFKDKLK